MPSYLLLESGGRLLLETGGGILLESSEDDITDAGSILVLAAVSYSPDSLFGVESLTPDVLLPAQDN